MQARRSRSLCAQKSFVVLDKDELRERLGAAVAQVVDLLCISEAEATRVLRFYKWDLTRLQASMLGWDARGSGDPSGGSHEAALGGVVSGVVGGWNEAASAADGRRGLRLGGLGKMLPGRCWPSMPARPPLLVQEEWFVDQEGVQQRVGLVDEQPATRRKEVRVSECSQAGCGENLSPLWVRRSSRSAVATASSSADGSVAACRARRASHVMSNACLRWPSPVAQEVCKICFEPFPVPDMLSARCKHLYCKVRRCRALSRPCLSGNGCLGSGAQYGVPMVL